MCKFACVSLAPSVRKPTLTGSSLPCAHMGRPLGKRALADAAALGDNEVAGTRSRRQKVLTQPHARACTWSPCGMLPVLSYPAVWRSHTSLTAPCTISRPHIHVAGADTPIFDRESRAPSPDPMCTSPRRAQLAPAAPSRGSPARRCASRTPSLPCIRATYARSPPPRSPVPAAAYARKATQCCCRAFRPRTKHCLAPPSYPAGSPLRPPCIAILVYPRYL